MSNYSKRIKRLLREWMIEAYAIVVGILDQDEVPAELLEVISGPIGFYRSLQERGELRERD